MTYYPSLNKNFHLESSEEVRDRVSGILADTTMLIDEVMDTVQSPAPEGTPEENPEEDSEEEVSPDSPTVD